MLYKPIAKIRKIMISYHLDKRSLCVVRTKMDFALLAERETITAVVNALAKAGVDLGENGSVIPRPKGKPPR